MNHVKTISVLFCFYAIALLSCGGAVQPSAQAPSADSAVAGFNANAPTAKDQAGLTPDSVIQILKQGNEFFCAGKVTFKDDSVRMKQTAGGQHPQAIILACIDSRVPVESVFNRGIGDVFVTRVAGNIVNQDVLGSLEYACKESGAKLILVLGHESCGAVKAAIDNVKLGNITALLSKIDPAVKTATGFTGDKTSKNSAFVHAVSLQNVQNSEKAIRDGSDILKQMELKGEIKIVGGIYDITTGHVAFVE